MSHDLSNVSAYNDLYTSDLLPSWRDLNFWLGLVHEVDERSQRTLARDVSFPYRSCGMLLDLQVLLCETVKVL